MFSGCKSDNFGGADAEKQYQT